MYTALSNIELSATLNSLDQIGEALEIADKLDDLIINLGGCFDDRRDDLEKVIAALKAEQIELRSKISLA